MRDVTKSNFRWALLVVVVMAAAMAGVSFILAMLIPRHPEPGYETILTARAPAPAE